MHGIELGVGVLHLGLVGYNTQAFEDRDPLDAGRVEDPNIPQAAVETEDIAHPRLGQTPRAGTVLTSVDVLVRQLDPPPRVRLSHGTKVRGRHSMEGPARRVQERVIPYSGVLRHHKIPDRAE